MSFTYEQKEIGLKKALVFETYLSVGQLLTKHETNDSVLSYGFRARNFGGMSDRLFRLNNLIEGVINPADYRIAKLECLTGISGDEREGLNLTLRNAEDNSLASPFSEIFMELGTGTSFTRDFPYVFRIIPDRGNDGSYIMEYPEEEMKIQTWLRENLNSTIKVRFRAYAFAEVPEVCDGYSTYLFTASDASDGYAGFKEDIQGELGHVDGPDLGITRLESSYQDGEELTSEFWFESNQNCIGQTSVEVQCVELDNTWATLDRDVTDSTAGGFGFQNMGFQKTVGTPTLIRVKRHGCDQCNLTEIPEPVECEPSVYDIIPGASMDGSGYESGIYGYSSNFNPAGGPGFGVLTLISGPDLHIGHLFSTSQEGYTYHISSQVNCGQETGMRMYDENGYEIIDFSDEESDLNSGDAAQYESYDSSGDSSWFYDNLGYPVRITIERVECNVCEEQDDLPV